MKEKETSIAPINEKNAKNAKIMVNFETRHICHTFMHLGSDEYKALLKRGYVKVGTVKGTDRFYWDSDFFNYRDKYPGSNQTDTITT